MLPREIDLADEPTARAVHAIGLRAYAVEAELIGFDGIPALSETLEELRAEPLRWLGTSGRTARRSRSWRGSAPRTARWTSTGSASTPAGSGSGWPPSC